MSIKSREFPNGFADWQETHYEVVQAITLSLRDDDAPENVAFLRRDQQGHGGLYELAEELTDKFEKKYQGIEFDGAFFDLIEEFMKQELEIKS